MVKKIIFDMDGVITTEQNYWNVAALTLWERLFEEKDVAKMEERTADIRKEVFCNDQTINYCKNIGVNSNWDLTYIVYVIAKLLNTKDFHKIYKALKDLNLNAMELFDYLGEQGFLRKGDVWRSLQDTFQEWYLGDTHYSEIYDKEPTLPGKRGLMRQEMPLFDVEQLAGLLESLKLKGYQLGIATGRITIEIKEPLKKWDLLRYFDENSIVTFTDVQKVEKEFGGVLAKPHPYMFLKALYGRDYPNDKIIAEDYDKSLLDDAIAVGDAGADILSAKAAGMKFVAVLTGVSGKAAEGYFKEQGADMILDNVLALSDAL